MTWPLSGRLSFSKILAHEPLGGQTIQGITGDFGTLPPMKNGTQEKWRAEGFSSQRTQTYGELF